MVCAAVVIVNVTIIVIVSAVDANTIGVFVMASSFRGPDCSRVLPASAGAAGRSGHYNTCYAYVQSVELM